MLISFHFKLALKSKEQNNNKKKENTREMLWQFIAYIKLENRKRRKTWTKKQQKKTCEFLKWMWELAA